MSQESTVRALEQPDFYPHPAERVEHVQTHISHVFLAGAYAYKLKKAVRFPFLDFATMEKRRHFCEEEVRLNRRLCPWVYLDVLPIVRTSADRLQLGGSGEPIDHVVRMRRLPADRMLIGLLAAGPVGTEEIAALARTVAAFHAGQPTGPEVTVHADPDQLRRRWEEETASTAPFVGALLAAEDHDVLADFGPWFIRTHATLLRARLAAGRIREGHGDLHAGNVCLLDAPVTEPAELPALGAGVYVFDCIEFSHGLRCNDVASEVAFLAMDVESRGRPDLAQHFVDTYVETTGDAIIPALLPFYGCYRARVRGKVEGLRAAEEHLEATERDAAEREARRHFGLAVRYAWQAGGPAIIACSGLSGSGKSTLADELVTATGFLLLGSDAIRKRSDDRPAAAPYGAGRYTPAAREATYEALCAQADEALAAGRGVIADATFLHAADRRQLEAVARRHRRPFVLVECRADEGVIRTRLAARERGPSLSDARWETYLRQCAEQEPLTEAEPHVVVDTTAGLRVARASALRALWRWRRGGTPSRTPR